MADIRDVDIRNVEVRDIRIPSWMTNQPRLPSAPPVTVEVGVPVIDIPGCVEAHIDNKKGTNDKLVDDDSDGARVFCDGNMPSFNPIQYNPEELQWTAPPPKPPVVKPPKTPDPPEVPKNAAPEVKAEVAPPCPGPNALRVGDVAQNQKERVSGYELQTVNGELVCVTLWEDIPLVAQYLPTAQVATTTAAIAVTAASSALLAKPLADLLLKAFKPVIKKVITKVQKLIGKKPPILSAKDRQAEQRLRNHAIRKLKGKE